VLHALKSAGWIPELSRTKREDNGFIGFGNVKKRSKYRYFTGVEWAEKFMDGGLLFRSLSHFKNIEDGEVRGDLREGSISYQPKGGLIGDNQTQGKAFRLPEGSYFDSGVKAEEIFILCASNSMTDELRIRFEAKACVQILRLATFCARIQYELPPTATFRAERVVYYSPANEPGPKWAFPDMIAFSKVDGYAWQDEYRFVFSLTDALKYGATAQKVVIPNQPPGTALPPAPPVPHQKCLTVKSLGDICKLHKFYRRV
jgi:hypothetical protein